MDFESVAPGDQRTTPARTVTEADIVNFAGVSGDFNHHHVDTERMADSGFGERVAHGMLVLSVATGLLWQSRTPAERDALVALYGVDDLRFRRPVTVGDTIHAETEIVGKDRHDHPDATGVVRYETVVRNQDDDAVLSCELLALVR
jgi:acyl dehydratase